MATAFCLPNPQTGKSSIIIATTNIFGGKKQSTFIGLKYLPESRFFLQ